MGHRYRSSDPVAFYKKIVDDALEPALKRVRATPGSMTLFAAALAQSLAEVCVAEDFEDEDWEYVCGQGWRKAHLQKAHLRVRAERQAMARN